MIGSKMDGGDADEIPNGFAAQGLTNTPLVHISRSLLQFNSSLHMVQAWPIQALIAGPVVRDAAEVFESCV